MLTPLCEADKPLVLQRLLKYREIDPVTKCWNWTSAKQTRTYGSYRYKGRNYRVPRLSAWIHNDFPIHNPKIFACHTCDNPPCFNPEHLFPGDTMLNYLDCLHKGRSRHLVGEATYSSKLNRHQVSRIRLLLDIGGLYQWEIANLFRISQSQVSRISTRYFWDHLPV